MVTMKVVRSLQRAQEMNRATTQFKFMQFVLRMDFQSQILHYVRVWLIGNSSGSVYVVLHHSLIPRENHVSNVGTITTTGTKFPKHISDNIHKPQQHKNECSCEESDDRNWFECVSWWSWDVQEIWCVGCVGAGHSESLRETLAARLKQFGVLDSCLEVSFTYKTFVRSESCTTWSQIET